MAGDDPHDAGWRWWVGTVATRLGHVWSRPRRLALLLSVLTAVLVYSIGEGIFPYYTSNHDEAVYLQQAAMLLEGHLTLSPPVAESFRPWFFVVDGGDLYPKYTPVTAAIFAVGGLLGAFRFALAGVAALAVALTYAVVSELFDGETGVVAACLLVLSPLFLVQASVFLSYVPAFTLNVLFAWAYLRADRTGSRRFAALAGTAIGLAFWARPYTAVLFATPFICHALWTLRGLDSQALVRQSTTAALGLAGVAAALGYNAVITGDPLVFPYQAFAPLDGPGFGHREIAGYERTYTPTLALEATARNLATYVTDWTPAGIVGTALAGGGLLTVLRRPRLRRDPRVLAVLALVVTIPVGNLYFWGTLNVLGDLSDPSDGLISYLGPYYHLGLLLPTVTLGALGARRVVAVTRRLRSRAANRRVAHATTVVILAVAVVTTGVTAGALVAPLQDNYETTERYEQAYEPFEDREFENAVVFMPDPYGQWLNHPFQALRNDPDFEGDAVYALQHREFAVVDAYPDRTLYRYTFRGEWVPYSGDAVTPRLREIDHVRGERVVLDLSLGVPEAVEILEVRASVNGTGNSTAASLPNDGIDATIEASNGTVTVTSPSFVENLTVPHDGESDLKFVAFVDYGALGGFEYVVRLPLRDDAGDYRSLTPYLEVCERPKRCGGEAAYIPGESRDGVYLNTTLEATDS